MVCPQVRQLPGAREVAAAGVNSDLRTVTEGNAEILQKPNPVTTEGVGVKKLRQVQLEEGKFCPDIRTNMLFNAIQQRGKALCCAEVPSYFPSDCATQSRGSPRQEYSHLWEQGCSCQADLLPAEVSARCQGVKGCHHTYLTYWGSLAGPNASADGCLRTATPNASAFLCSPLQTEEGDFERAAPVRWRGRLLF